MNALEKNGLGLRTCWCGVVVPSKLTGVTLACRVRELRNCWERLVERNPAFQTVPPTIIAKHALGLT